MLLNYCENCTLSNEVVGFIDGERYVTQVIPESGYSIDPPAQLSIVMDGQDITYDQIDGESVWTAPGAGGIGTIIIPSVTGDVEITVVGQA